MSELISGKEAWIAKSDKKDVQYRLGGMDWCDLTDKDFYYWSSDRFLDESLNYKFRLKPRTITLNNIEVPAPFEPKEGDEAWFISDDHGCGYAVVECSEFTKFFFGAWRTEEEIKQVVEALRSVFK